MEMYGKQYNNWKISKILKIRLNEFFNFADHNFALKCQE